MLSGVLVVFIINLINTMQCNNDLSDIFSLFTVSKMLQCARQCGRRNGATDYITFGEFCVFVREMQNQNPKIQHRKTTPPKANNNSKSNHYYLYFQKTMLHISLCFLILLFLYVQNVQANVMSFWEDHVTQQHGELILPYQNYRNMASLFTIQ